MIAKLARFALFSAMFVWPVLMSVSSANAQDKPITLVAFGDSLTAGYGLPQSQSFASQLQVALDKRGRKVQVVNAGVSGDTTSGGLERIEWTLASGADGVILELGANDALRGVDPKQTRKNLDQMLTVIAGKGADVLLTGMKAPGNWGGAYQTEFDAIYPDLAAKHGVSLYPFFLDGVFAAGVAEKAVDRSLILEDGLHPTGKGVAIVVEKITPAVEALLDRIAARKAASK